MDNSEQEMSGIFPHDPPQQVVPETCSAERAEYRLEFASPSTWSLLSRMASVSDNDHDVFTEYPEDPLFPRQEC